MDHIPRELRPRIATLMLHIVPSLDSNWLTLSGKLWHATLGVSTLIEPVLLEEGDASPLYHDIMKTGVAV